MVGHGQVQSARCFWREPHVQVKIQKIKILNAQEFIDFLKKIYLLNFGFCLRNNCSMFSTLSITILNVHLNKL